MGNGEWRLGNLASLSFRAEQSGVEKSHSGMIRVALEQEISGLRVSIEHRQHNPQPLAREAGVNLLV